MGPRALADCGVIILGGTAGVGLETAARFAEEGARVVLLGRNPERGAAACEKIRDRSSGARVDFVKTDAMLPQDVVRAAKEAGELYTPMVTGYANRRPWMASILATASGRATATLRACSRASLS